MDEPRFFKLKYQETLSLLESCSYEVRKPLCLGIRIVRHLNTGSSIECSRTRALCCFFCRLYVRVQRKNGSTPVPNGFRSVVYSPQGIQKLFSIPSLALVLLLPHGAPYSSLNVPPVQCVLWLKNVGFPRFVCGLPQRCPVPKH